MYSVNTTSNRYNSVGGNTLTYDNAGNLTTDKDGYQYTYDGACPRMFSAGKSRITNIKDSSDNDIVTYTYDALNRRIKKQDHITSSNTRMYYYSDNWQVLAEHDGTSFANVYIYGNYIDEVLTMTDSSTNDYYYVHDHLYSPAVLVSNAGTVVERYEYDAYGDVTILSSAFSVLSSSQYGNQYYFTGRRLDTLDDGDFEIMYYRNRYYDTHAGRFLTQDPLGITPNPQKPNKFDVVVQCKDGMNVYEYVKESPVLYVDSYGLSCGVIVKQNDINWSVGDMGHAWLETTSSLMSWTSMGWWPVGDYADLGDWLTGVDGYLKSPDSNEGESSDNEWNTTQKRTRSIRFGPSKNKKCQCATCKDIALCLNYLKDHAHGIWRGPFPSLSSSGHVTGDCRAFSNMAINACCLMKE